MMILTSSLTIKSGVYFLGSSSFTGRAIEVDKGKIINLVILEENCPCYAVLCILDVVDGKLVSKTSYIKTEYFFNEIGFVLAGDIPDAIKDVESLHIEGNEDPFSGVVYLSYEGLCIDAYHCRNGRMEVHESWHLNGHLAAVTKYGPPMEEYKWHKDGKWMVFSVSKSFDYGATLRFNERGDVSMLHLHGEYFNKSNEFANSLCYPVVVEFGDIYQFFGGEEIRISGDLINDVNFKDISAGGFLNKTTHIDFHGTALTVASLGAIESLSKKKNVKEVVFRQASRDERHFALAIRDNVVDMNVKYW